MDDLLGLHGEQVAPAHGAHVEPLQAVFVGKGDHFIQGRADFVADDGQLKARKSHGASLLWLHDFG